MNYNQILFGISILLVAICFLIVGFLFKKNPPKQVNYFYGYRSKSVMKNQKQWDFAQKRAALELIRAGLLQFLALLILPFIPSDILYTPYIIAGIALILIINCLLVSIRIKKALKKEFNV